MTISHPCWFTRFGCDKAASHARVVKGLKVDHRPTFLCSDHAATYRLFAVEEMLEIHAYQTKKVKERL